MKEISPICNFAYNILTVKTTHFNMLYSSETFYFLNNLYLNVSHLSHASGTSYWERFRNGKMLK